MSSSIFEANPYHFLVRQAVRQSGRELSIAQNNLKSLKAPENIGERKSSEELIGSSKFYI